jgi:hypothetical protein
MRVGADAVILVLIAVIIALFVGSRWRHLSRSRADLRGAKDGIGKARTTRNSAFKSVILPLAVFGLFLYVVLANAR